MPAPTNHSHQNVDRPGTSTIPLMTSLDPDRPGNESPVVVLLPTGSSGLPR